ncbi:hypothetical protein M885DRAFT_557386 [Pelagophyceae sp. CCMP2097]|nr:hypothetical protein M885DRAFT_557386 [Pelagophyceae sp. CCMP2097]
MDDPPTAALKSCFMGEPRKHCTKCKSRHYCSKKCQLVDWHERGHKAQCKRLAAEFQDRLLDSLMPLKTKEEPAIFADVAPVLNTKAEAPGTIVDDAPDRVLDSRVAWTFAIFFRIYAAWATLLWRVFPEKLDLKNDEPIIVADVAPAAGLKVAGRLSAVRTDKAAAAETTAWYRRAAEQGDADMQFNLGNMFADGEGVAQSDAQAARWWRLAAAQGHAEALYNFGACHDAGKGVPQDLHEALRLYKRAAAKGQPPSAARAVFELTAQLFP